MAKWSTLKAAIANVIKTNGTQAITGSVLQNVLNNIVSSLGENYQFVGIATTLTNPGTPDGNVFYLAGEGIYANFSNLVIDTGQLGILIWNGSWSKQTLEIGAGSGNMILEWNTDVATTRKQVLYKNRKTGMVITYKKDNEKWVTEQFIGTNLYDSGWADDANWNGIISSYYTFLVDNVNTLINSYFKTLSKQVGDIIDIKNIVGISTNWVGVFCGLHAGCFIKCNKCTSAQGFIVVDPQNMEVLYKSNSTSFYYKAEKYCYVIFSTLKGYIYTTEVFTDDCALIPSIEELYNNLLELSTLTADVTYRIDTIHAPYQGNTYFNVSNYKVGNTFVFKTKHFGEEIKGGWGCIVIPLNKDEVIKFEKIRNNGQGIIAVDRYSFEVLEIIDKNSTGYTSSYTATTDIYIVASFIISDISYFEVSNTTYAIYKSLILAMDYEQNKGNFVLKDTTKELINLPVNIDVPNGINVELFAQSIMSKDVLDNQNPIQYYLNTDNVKLKIYGEHLRLEGITANNVFNIKRYSIENINGGNPTATATSNIRVVNRNGGDGATKNILVSGDSLIEGGLTTPVGLMYKLLSEDADYNINQIGLLQKSYKDVLYNHEGHGGWSWETWTNPIYENTPYAGKKNPFMHNGVLDFKNYMSVNFSGLPQTIDYFIMSLGTNDVGHGTLTKTDEQLLQVIEQAKTFINALLADFPNCKVGIGLPGIGYQMDEIFKAERFKLLIMKLNSMYIETFDNGKYNPNVTCIMHGAWADPNNSYIMTEQPIGQYIPTEERICSDRIHPDISGYECWGLAYYSKIRAWMQGLL